MKKILLKIMDDCQNLSNYADTKLGGLIAFSSATTLGILTIMNNLDGVILIYIQFAFFFNITALFFSFYGFLSKNVDRNLERVSNKNLFFYKYLSTLSPEELINNIELKYGLKNDNNNLYLDISKQIIHLSINANNKFKYFNISLYLIITAILTPIGFLLFWLFKKWNTK